MHWSVMFSTVYNGYQHNATFKMALEKSSKHVKNNVNNTYEG